jgi:hypothetical protein
MSFDGGIPRAKYLATPCSAALMGLFADAVHLSSKTCEGDARKDAICEDTRNSGGTERWQASHLGANIVCHHVEIVAGLCECRVVIVPAVDPIWAPGRAYRHLGARELLVKYKRGLADKGNCGSMMLTCQKRVSEHQSIRLHARKRQKGCISDVRAPYCWLFVYVAESGLLASIGSS